MQEMNTVKLAKAVCPRTGERLILVTHQTGRSRWGILIHSGTQKMTRQLRTPALLAISMCLLFQALTAANETSNSLGIENGWYVHNGKAVWGLTQHNGWWRAGQRPNITRNAPGLVRPNRTEDLDKLTSAMLRFGYPGFEHNYGLWYDRRRDAHDEKRRDDDKVVSPFFRATVGSQRQRKSVGRALEVRPHKIQRLVLPTAEAVR